MLDKNINFDNSIIEGDAVAGDKNTYFKDCTINIFKQEEKSIKKIVENRIADVVENSQIAISNFKELNPDLDLKILQEERITNFIVTPIGPNEVSLGELTVMNQGINKLNEFIEDGKDITLEDGEFKFQTNISGLPEFMEVYKQQLFIKNPQKKTTQQVKLKFYDDDNNLLYEILTNIHVVMGGSRRLKILITGLEFIGELNFYLNHYKKHIEDINISFTSDTNNIDYLLKTIEIFLLLSKNPIIEIFSIEHNLSLFKIQPKGYNEELNLISFKEFLIKYKKVIDTYNIIPVPYNQLSEIDRLFIEIVFAYLNKKSIAFKYYPLRISGKNDNFVEAFNSQNIDKKLNLAFDMHLEFTILNKKISLGSNEIILTKPKIIPIDEEYIYEIEYEQIVYNFDSI